MLKCSLLFRHLHENIQPFFDVTTNDILNKNISRPILPSRPTLTPLYPTPSPLNFIVSDLGPFSVGFTSAYDLAVKLVKLKNVNNLCKYLDE